MSAPFTYHTDFLPASAGALFDQLRNELAWVRHGEGTVPRMEYYVSKLGLPYTYGKGEFARTYQPQPTHDAIEAIRIGVEMYLDEGVTFEVCFLNRYLNQSDHLGWHSDNSPEMDDGRPIAIVSFGVSREIQFRTIGSADQVERLVLEHNSLCFMAPGMQDTHQHRIPKAGRQCGERVSLTFRGYKEPA